MTPCQCGESRSAVTKGGNVVAFKVDTGLRQHSYWSPHDMRTSEIRHKRISTTHAENVRLLTVQTGLCY